MGVGSAEITITVVDDAGLSDTVTVDVTVEALPNVPPLIDSRAPAASTITIDAGDSESVSIVVTDEDVPTLTYSATSSDTSVATVSSSGDGNYLVNAVSSGSAVITLVVEDDIGQTDSESFTVNVPAVNVAPEITGRTPAGDPITSIGISDTDPVTLAVTDEDTSTLVFTASSSDTTIVDIDSIDQDGIVFLSGLAAGSATITIDVADDEGLTDTISFDVDVPGPANAPPQVNGALNDSTFEEALLITPIDVSGVFTDPDGDALTFSVDQLPAGLSLNAASGVITGTPSAVGTTSVLVSATDASGTNTAVTASPFDLSLIHI